MSYLTISNQGPQIQLSHIIKDHPRWTAIAEAVRNMLQASTALCPIEPVELKIRKLDLNGLIELEHPDGSIINRFKNKLSFLNPGGTLSNNVIGNQHFDKGNEDVYIDITIVYDMLSIV